jgi:hypothetical protein
VQLLVSSPDSNLCGYAWLLPTLSDDFDAFSVVDIACLGLFTPTHEMAHSMGSQHAPEDGATDGLFPYSYGFKDPIRGFRTVMALRCPDVDCPRIPNFSTPVAPDGRVTGSALQNNALSIDTAAFTVANWRQSTSLVPPLAPSTLVSEVEGGTVVLSWSGPSDIPLASAASAYTLQVGTSPGSSNVFNAPVGALTMVTGTIEPGIFFWRVVASNGAGVSGPSVERQFVVTTGCTAPGSPEQFSFVLDGRLVTLRWAEPLTGDAPTTYTIEAGSQPGLSDLYAASTGSSALSAVVPAPPGIYHVRIRAQNACGTSAPSIERTITVP